MASFLLALLLTFKVTRKLMIMTTKAAAASRKRALFFVQAELAKTLKVL
jgi:hypothetical protein